VLGEEVVVEGEDPEDGPGTEEDQARLNFLALKNGVVLCVLGSLIIGQYIHMAAYGRFSPVCTALVILIVGPTILIGALTALKVRAAVTWAFLLILVLIAWNASMFWLSIPEGETIDLADPFVLTNAMFSGVGIVLTFTLFKGLSNLNKQYLKVQGPLVSNDGSKEEVD
jgi:hypothetical protein